MRIPALETAPVRRHVNGPESFTPDDRYHPRRGARVPELLRRRRLQLDRHRLGGGRRQGAGGVDRGRRAADGSLGRRHPPLRAVPGATRATCATRTVEMVGLALRHALALPAAGRPRAACARACCTTGSPRAAPASAWSMGWERANWFARAGHGGRRTTTATAARTGSPCAADEHRAVREAVGLFDQSSFAKLLLEGPDARGRAPAALRQRRGRAGRAHRLHADAERARRHRVRPDRHAARPRTPILVVTVAAAADARRRLDPPRALGDARVALTDVTVGLRGARRDGPALARAAVARSRDADLSNAAFPFGTSREIELGYAPVRADAHHLRRRARLGAVRARRSSPPASTTRSSTAGEDLGLRHAGYHAMDSLRMEKGTARGATTSAARTRRSRPGSASRCAWTRRTAFIGRDALLRQRDAPLAAPARRVHARRPGAAAARRRADLARRRAGRPHHLGRLRPHARPRRWAWATSPTPTASTDAFVASGPLGAGDRDRALPGRRARSSRRTTRTRPASASSANRPARGSRRPSARRRPSPRRSAAPSCASARRRSPPR